MAHAGAEGYRIVWRMAAEDDLSAIIDFIAADAPENALQFGARLQEKALLLAQNPRMGRAGRPGLPAEVRELVVHPNYLVFYRVIDAERTIEILRIKHAAQQMP